MALVAAAFAAPPAGADPLDLSFGSRGMVVEQMGVDVFGLAGPTRASDGSIATLWADGQRRRWSSAGRRLGRRAEAGFGGPGFVPADLLRRDDLALIAGGTSERALAAAGYHDDLTVRQDFGRDGLALAPVPGADDVTGRAIAQSRRGAVVVAGGATRGGVEEFALARFDRAGRPDPRFGGGGVVTTRLAGTAARQDHPTRAHAVAALGDGLVVAGQAWDARARRPVAVVMRHRADGSLDPAFGGDGIVAFAFRPRTPSVARAVGLQRVGAETRVVVGGHTGTEGAPLFAVARLRSDGSLDRTFGGGRPMVTSFWGGTASDLLVDREGRIVLSGGADLHVPALGVARYTPDGRPDRRFGAGGRLCTAIPGQMPAPGGVDETHVVPAPANRLLLGAAWGVDRAKLVLARYRPFRVESATCVRVEPRNPKRGVFVRALLGRRAQMAIDVGLVRACTPPQVRVQHLGRVRFPPHRAGVADFVWDGRIRGPRPPRQGCYQITPLLLDATGRAVERFAPGYL